MTDESDVELSVESRKVKFWERKYMKENLLKEIDSIEEFLNRSTSCLQESDSEFTPIDGSLSVAQQMAHIAQTVDWFVDAIESDTGFDMDFEGHWRDVMPINSLKVAREWLARAFDNARSVVSKMSEQELATPLPEGLVMGGQPKYSVVSGISDHTAHHRGALTVYSRLLGKTPQMPYMEE